MKRTLMLTAALLCVGLSVPSHAGGDEKTVVVMGPGSLDGFNFDATALMPSIEEMKLADLVSTITVPDAVLVSTAEATEVALVCHTGEIPRTIYVDRDGPASTRIRDGPSEAWPC